MNPHHLKFDQREWLDNICMIPVVFSLFPIPLAIPGVMTSFFFKDGGWPVPAFFFSYLGVACYLMYLNERAQSPPKWAKKLFKL